MPDLKKLTAAYWKGFKKRSEIENKPWFSSDASVGSAITKVNRRRASWQRSRTEMNLMGYFRALEVLKKQMGNFLATKEFKTDVAQQFYGEIVKWRKEIVTKLTRLAAIYGKERNSLAKAGADELGQTFDTFIL